MPFYCDLRSLPWYNQTNLKFWKECRLSLRKRRRAVEFVWKKPNQLMLCYREREVRKSDVAVQAGRGTLDVGCFEQAWTKYQSIIYLSNVLIKRTKFLTYEYLFIWAWLRASVRSFCTYLRLASCSLWSQPASSAWGISCGGEILDDACLTVIQFCCIRLRHFLPSFCLPSSLSLCHDVAIQFHLSRLWHTFMPRGRLPSWKCGEIYIMAVRWDQKRWLLLA